MRRNLFLSYITPMTISSQQARLALQVSITKLYKPQSGSAILKIRLLFQSSEYWFPILSHQEGKEMLLLRETCRHCTHYFFLHVIEKNLLSKPWMQRRLRNIVTIIISHLVYPCACKFGDSFFNQFVVFVTCANNMLQLHNENCYLVKQIMLNCSSRISWLLVNPYKF